MASYDKKIQTTQNQSMKAIKKQTSATTKITTKSSNNKGQRKGEFDLQS